jgi:hypothetical protein
MTLNELRDEVYLITNRPDLADRTLSAIRSTTLSIHQREYWYKDIRESGIDLGSSAYIHSWEYRTLIPRFRALKYARKTDVSGFEGEVLTVLTTDDALDNYQLSRQNVVYAAGDNLQIRSSTELRYVLLGWYENPNVTVDGYSSWIARDHPFAIIYGAAAQIFKSVGKTEEFQAYALMMREQEAAISISNVQVKGY